MSQELLHCFRCNSRTPHNEGTCSHCGSEGGIQGWRCVRCSDVVRGPLPDGPRTCGACPEPRATEAEVLQWTDETGACLDGRLDECRECGAWVRCTNRLPRGQRRCLECAVGKRVQCAHPTHRGDRATMRHTAQLGVYAHRTKAGKVFQRRDVLCQSCFLRSNAICPQELDSQPGLGLLPEAPFVLTESPRNRYPASSVIFDSRDAAAIGERRVIRCNRDSIHSAEWGGRTVQWLVCEELRGGESKQAVTYNRRVLRALRRQVEARKSRDPSATLETLGWVLAECAGLDSDGRAVFTIAYAAPRLGETIASWAGRVLSR